MDKTKRTILDLDLMMFSTFNYNGHLYSHKIIKIYLTLYGSDCININIRIGDIILVEE